MIHFVLEQEKNEEIKLHPGTHTPVVVVRASGIQKPEALFRAC